MGHWNPSSRVQVALQPSPLRSLPSSQSSMPTRNPSPHRAARHATPGRGHAHPISNVQVALHPSPWVVLRSSHCSDPPMRPSPHTAVVRQGIPGCGQTQSVSTRWQSARHPSPERVFPSSQASLASIRPLPHIGDGDEPSREESSAASMKASDRVSCASSRETLLSSDDVVAGHPGRTVNKSSKGIDRDMGRPPGMQRTIPIVCDRASQKLYLGPCVGHGFHPFAEGDATPREVRNTREASVVAEDCPHVGARLPPSALERRQHAYAAGPVDRSSRRRPCHQWAA